jgi:hypothetical protein
MAYIIQSDVNALLPEAYQIKGMDDDRTGEATAGLWDAIAQAASDEVDALLSPSYSTPITPTPTACKQAAIWIALEMIYGRRNVENKMVTDRANKWRERIESIGIGETPLSADDSPVISFDAFDPTYGVITEDLDA